MKISKKKAIEFSIYEHELRETEWSSYDPEDTPEDWSLKDQIIQDKDYEQYLSMDKAAHQIATMMFDGLFSHDDISDLKKRSKFYGKKLWELAKDYYVIGDHDT